MARRSMSRLDWTPARHEERILHRLRSEGPLTEKAIAGGLISWLKSNDCYDALRRLVERGDVVKIDGSRKWRFALKAWADRWRR